MATGLLSDLKHPVTAWDRDVDTAMQDLGATAAQAAVVAAHALAWRVTFVVAPLTVAAASVATAVRQASAQAVVTPIGLGFFGPLVLTVVLTFPVAWWGSAETFFRGSRDARLRFGTTGFVFPYYGWRYAVRGRTRPWGALTQEEWAATDPSRAGVHSPAPTRRSYWPE